MGRLILSNTDAILIHITSEIRKYKKEYFTMISMKVHIFSHVFAYKAIIDHANFSRNTNHTMATF